MEEKKELISKYDELSIGDKRRELGREIAETTVVVQKLISDINPNYQMKSMDEFGNLFEENTSEDKYLTGLYEDMIDLQESISDYCDFATNLYYDDVNEQNQDGGQPYVYANNTGFVKVGIIGILALLVSIGIIILGIVIC